VVVVEEARVPNRGFKFESRQGNVYKFNSYRAFAWDTVYFDRVTYTCECKPD
jgi:hypothetical protein